MPQETIYRTRSEKETLLLGREIGSNLRRNRKKVLLYGELGTGKTALARGIVEGMGIQDSSVVHSPTFSLVHEYPTESGVVYHIDLYRLQTRRDLYSIGIEEILAGDSVVIIEWAERLLLSVAKSLTVRIDFGEDPDSRTFHIRED